MFFIDFSKELVPCSAPLMIHPGQPHLLSVGSPSLANQKYVCLQDFFFNPIDKTSLHANATRVAFAIVVNLGGANIVFPLGGTNFSAGTF